MIVNLMGLFAGLMMPLAVLLGFLDRWFPSLHFSWDDYIEAWGGRAPRRFYWNGSFALAILMWIVFVFYFYVSLYEQSISLFAFALSIGIIVSGFVVITWLRKRRIEQSIEALNWEKLTLHAILAKKIDASIEAGGQITFDPDVDMKLNQLADLDARIESLKASLIR